MENKGSRTLTNGTWEREASSTSGDTIEELEEDSNYTIILTAINAAGSAVSDPVTTLTREAGERMTDTCEGMTVTCWYWMR